MRKVTFPFYVVAFLSEVVWMAIVPLAPTYADRFDLSKVETGFVLAAAGFATLVVSLPIGILADRIGTRRLTIGASALVAASSLGQALAFDFWSLFLARVVFGVALGAIWTAGLAWIADAVPSRRGASALGVPVTVAGLGIMAGPLFAGAVAGAFGLRMPFLVLAAAAAAATLMLARADGHETPFRHESLLRTLRVARAHRIVFASCVVMAVIGLTNGGVNLLVPLTLRHNGHSPGAIGLVFTASSSLFVAASLVLTRLGTRMVTLRVVGVAAMLYGATILLPVAGTSTAIIVSFMLIRSPAWATLSTLSYPLGALGAERADLGRGAVMGLLNLVWGAAGTLGPLLAAGIAQAAGVHSAFAVLAVLMAATGVWLTASGRRERDELRAARPSLEAP
jgi:predicted MFS family arabinose efflux permease